MKSLLSLSFFLLAGMAFAHPHPRIEQQMSALFYPGQILIQIFIIPSTDKAARIADYIDQNGDHDYSDAEVSKFANEVLQNARVNVDQAEQDITLIHANIDDYDMLEDSHGAIYIQARVEALAPKQVMLDMEYHRFEEDWYIQTQFGGELTASSVVHLAGRHAVFVKIAQ